MRAGIDFDRVLFNTEKFKEELQQNVPRFDETYQHGVTDEGIYSPELHAESMEISTEKILDVVEKARKFVYPDVSELKDIKDRFDLILVSRGDPNFQNMKIANSGVEEYFDEVVIVQDKSKETADIEFLIDDRAEELERTDLPEDHKFLFDRSKHGLKDAVQWLNRFQ